MPGVSMVWAGLRWIEVGSAVDETVQGRTLTGNHQAGVGAELTGALGQRGDEPLRQCLATLPQGLPETGTPD
jgi:hypothetical protein